MKSLPNLQSIIFEATQRCNHACLHCYNVWNGETFPGSGETYPRGELDTPQTLSLLDKTLAETTCKHITITGGEPLLRQDLPEILDFLQLRQISTTIISNGHLLTEAKVVNLLNLGVRVFELPLLSYRAEIHDRLSASPGAFDAVLAAMAHIRYHGGLFITVFVATKINLPDLHDTIHLSFAFGAQGLMLNRFNPGGRGRAYLEQLLPSASELRAALAEAQAASEEFNFPIFCSIPIQPCLIDHKDFPRLGFGFCSAGTDRAYYTLDPLGNIRPCNHTPLILGNLLLEPFSTIVSSEKLANFTRTTPDFCQGCSLLNACQGGCKASAQVCYGSIKSEEPFLQYAHNIIRNSVSPMPSME